MNDVMFEEWYRQTYGPVNNPPHLESCKNAWKYALAYQAEHEKALVEFTISETLAIIGIQTNKHPSVPNISPDAIIAAFHL